MATLSLEQVTKVFANGVEAVRALDLDVDEGEFVVLVGPSGCGKTTALRMVAGLEDVTSGTIRLDGKVANDLSAKQRDVAMVFQNYALYPHLNVLQNIAFSLRVRGVPKHERERKAREAADVLGLTEVVLRKPRQLSGGQRQRVAMGRALVREPSVFLMDEPLSNLDANLRVQMRSEVLRVQRRLGVATLYVTHDQTEAMTMGDRVALLRDGTLQQLEAPQELYESPANLFVATFIGSPPMNLYEGAIAGPVDGLVLSLGSQRLALPVDLGRRRPGLVAGEGRNSWSVSVPSIWRWPRGSMRTARRRSQHTSSSSRPSATNRSSISRRTRGGSGTEVARGRQMRRRCRRPGILRVRPRQRVSRGSTRAFGSAPASGSRSPSTSAGSISSTPRRESRSEQPARGSDERQERADAVTPAPATTGTAAAFRPEGDGSGPRLSARRRQQLAGWLFLIPAIAYLLFAFALPIVYNVVLSFEEATPATIANFTAPFAGLDNYRVVLNDPTSRMAIVNTVEFTFGSLLGQFILGFALALLFSLRFPGRTVARSLIIVPWLLPLIVTGVIFKFLFQAEGGAVNQLLMNVGLADEPIQWLNDPDLAPWTILIANIWLGVPFFTLLLYSALQDVPVEVREAAVIDGAGPWQRLRLIIVPIILPVIEVTLLLGFVFTVKVFDLVVGLTGGGPANATQLITTWSYNLSFQQFSFGQGAALNNLLLVLALICAPLYLWLSRGSLRTSSGADR